MRNLSLLALVLALTVPVQAQEPKAAPAQAAAHAAFVKMASLVYRARDAGVEELRFSFEVETLPQDRPAERHGPFRIHWSATGGWQLLDAEGKPDPQPEKRLSVPFTNRVVNDLIGWDAATMVAGRSLRLRDPRTIEIAIPGQDTPDEVEPRGIALELDDDGTLRRQTIIGTGGILLSRLEYRYLDHAGRRLVAKVRQESGGGRALREHSYQDLGGFTFLLDIRTRNADRRTETVRYRDIEILKAAPSSGR
ncbi:MAG: hypothetical protein H6807_09475 [Planctomycetes bacterium]|nr:hypothetical protein [Planctomycetota bacterium]